MTRFLQRYFSWALVCTAACAWVNTEAFADSDELQPTLILRVLNLAQIPNKVLIQAKEHVQRIYHDAGIHIVWLDGKDAPQASLSQNGLQLTIEVVPESVARMIVPGNNGATGFATSHDGQGPRAYVFSHRVEDHARNLPTLDRQAAEGLILGHVIAHEAGHLMLPFGLHSPTGIMRAQMDLGSLREALRGNLLFTSEQIELIRTALLRQSEHQD
jgi:hypothetical protein